MWKPKSLVVAHTCYNYIHIWICIYIRSNICLKYNIILLNLHHYSHHTYIFQFSPYALLLGVSFFMLVSPFHTPKWCFFLVGKTHGCWVPAFFEPPHILDTMAIHVSFIFRAYNPYLGGVLNLHFSWLLGTHMVIPTILEVMSWLFRSADIGHSAKPWSIHEVFPGLGFRRVFSLIQTGISRVPKKAPSCK